MKVSASLLACDYLNLEAEINKIEKAGADLLHLDIMDGHYVNNFAFGIDVIRKIKSITKLQVEAHLEIDNAEAHIENFAQAGADIIIIQADCVYHPIRLLKQIKSLGKVAGYAINPGESIDKASEISEYIDYLLVMAAEPGFGGQSFNERCVKKIKCADQVRKLNDEAKYLIGVDGGVTQRHTKALKEAGTDIIVAGSAVFRTTDYTENIRRLLFEEPAVS